MSEFATVPWSLAHLGRASRFASRANSRQSSSSQLSLQILDPGACGSRVPTIVKLAAFNYGVPQILPSFQVLTPEMQALVYEQRVFLKAQIHQSGKQIKSGRPEKNGM